jgi:hypothetical protein
MSTEPPKTPNGHRPGKSVHDAFRAGIRLRSKTWGKADLSPQGDRRRAKAELRNELSSGK